MSDNPSFPADEYLSAEEVKTLHDLLNKQLQDILEGSRENVKSFGKEREVDADALDVAVSESNRDFALRLADRERRLLQKIKHALGRISQGEYGACESCGGEITYPRLMARPVATLCIDCKTVTEQLERPRGAFV